MICCPDGSVHTHECVPILEREISELRASLAAAEDQLQRLKQGPGVGAVQAALTVADSCRANPAFETLADALRAAQAELAALQARCEEMEKVAIDALSDHAGWKERLAAILTPPASPSQEANRG